MKLIHLLLGSCMLLLGLVACTKDNENGTEEKPATVVELKIKNPPSQTIYFEKSKTLDLTGLVVTLVYSDKSEKDVVLGSFNYYHLTCSPANGAELTFDDESVVIQLENSDVSIKQPVSLRKRLVITNLPIKTSYYLGDTIDYTGLLLSLTHDDGTTEELGYDLFEKNDIHIGLKNGYPLINMDYKKMDFFYKSEYDNIISIAINYETVADIDGNVYPLCKIGSQIWMAENLKTTHLNDGTSITRLNTDKSVSYLSMISTPTYAWYLNDMDQSDLNNYGAYYNYEAVKTGLLAPKGWHIPTKAEIQTLYSSMYEISEDGTIVSYHPINSVFFPVHSGYVTQQGNGDWWSKVGESSYYWTSTIYPYNNSLEAVLILDGDFYVNETGLPFTSGLTVRCIKDAE